MNILLLIFIIYLVSYPIEYVLTIMNIPIIEYISSYFEVSLKIEDIYIIDVEHSLEYKKQFKNIIYNDSYFININNSIITTSKIYIERTSMTNTILVALFVILITNIPIIVLKQMLYSHEYIKYIKCIFKCGIIIISIGIIYYELLKIINNMMLFNMTDIYNLQNNTEFITASILFVFILFLIGYLNNYVTNRILIYLSLGLYYLLYNDNNYSLFNYIYILISFELIIFIIILIRIIV